MYQNVLLDAHCDTLSCECRMIDSKYHVSLEKAKNFQHYGQFFAIFSGEGQPNRYKTEAEKICAIKANYDKSIEKFNTMIKEYPELVSACRSCNDLQSARMSGKIAAFLSVEGAEQTMGHTLDEVYADGVRMLTLTWNYRNFVGGTCATGGGMTQEGKCFLRRAQELGIIVDLSHASEELFWDAFKYAKKPIITSHSNSKAICSHRRNLTDEQFQALIKIGGVTGINLCDEFVTDGGGSDINAVCRHIKHFLSLGGENNIAMGGDWDGVDTLPKGIHDVSDASLIQLALHEDGICDEIIDKIFWSNLERVIKDCL